MKKKRIIIGRKTAAAVKRSRTRAKETPEQREKRLESNRLRQATRRATETIVQREIRLLTERKRMASKRANERAKNKEKYVKRLEADRARIAARRAAETLEEREKRLLSERKRQAARRAAETVEERERRLMANRMRIRALKQSAQKERCKAVCEKVKGHSAKLDKRKKVNNQICEYYQKLSNTENFVIYSDSGMPVLNYSGAAFDYSRSTACKSPGISEATSKAFPSTKKRKENNSTVSKNALKLSAYILMNKDGSCYSGENAMPMTEQLFYNYDNNQQTLPSGVENVSLCFPICEIEESTEIITPD